MTDTADDDNAVPRVTLNSGRNVPQLGYGTFKVAPADAAAAVGAALEAGYRHIDTAQMYGNEAEVGAGIAASGIGRSNLFLTSKLNNGNHRPDDARRSFEESLARLDTDYLDLFLIHWPLPTRYDGDFVGTWKVLEEFAADGRARSIGVSNFQVPHLQRLLTEADTVPAVNQVEVHPLFGNEQVRTFCREHDIAVEAWSPLAQGAVLDEPAVRELAERLGRTAAQVVLRWHLQRGDIVFPKSMSPARMRENFDVFGFELDGDSMAQIAALDRGPEGRVGPDPDVFDRI
ncbi:aldo/keto reductase [Tomitella fengzijianii]|uniref:Aldo/keto reductase n=1 Tax=Tomitella fengzijianii TaxID=2597660 RepID=A0A516X6A9_9ACTN|nr:aldo/keto reductase [Tomitella fengzijianii]QDQ98612.1 aldo/keto reductase [Tomitella fengzijianii]